MKLFRQMIRAISGIATKVLDPLAVLDSQQDWSNVKDVPIGYEKTTDTLIPLKNITLDTVNVAEELEVKGMTYLDDDVVVGAGLSVRGDLVVDGTTYTTEEESLDTTSDYLVLRHNQESGLGSNEHSGIIVHNYNNSKNASIAVDNKGIWRVADNASESTTTYTNISQYDGKYYNNLHDDEVSIVHGAPIKQDADELSEVVYKDKYYKWDSVHWFEVILSNNTLYFDIENPITDEDLITQLESLDKADLFYYRSLSIMSIDDTTNEPLLTRDEEENLPEGTLLKWNGEKAIAIDVQPSINGQALIAKITPNTEDQAAHYFRLTDTTTYIKSDEVYDLDRQEAELPDNPTSTLTLEVYDPDGMLDGEANYYIYNRQLYQATEYNSEGAVPLVVGIDITTGEFNGIEYYPNTPDSLYNDIINSGSIGTSVTIYNYTSNFYYNDDFTATNLDSSFVQSTESKLADITIDANNNWYDNGAPITSLNPYQVGKITDPIDPITGPYELYRLDGTIKVATGDSTLSYDWGLSGSSTVFVGTMEEYKKTLDLLPGEEGYLPNNSIVLITDSTDYILAEDKE